MTESFKIVYAYKFGDSSTIRFDLVMDGTTLALQPGKREDLPEWTLLGYSQCANCPLDRNAVIRCPIAANFSEISEKFTSFTSHDRVSVAVIVEERTYTKNTTIQMGLSPLLGIIMTTSGCPILEQLKPMVRFHLPFASLEETIFRMVSMHLVAQYLRKSEGKPAEWSLEGLTKIYAEVAKVNRDFAERLVGASRSDVNINALVNLDAFAKMVPLAADKMLKKISPFFSALLQ
ncbi:MAG: hypothetical protein M0042_15910 [Nitrospiraceae bacterium]|nr:hypothetical protein [Nitrospiraceae bacterium]